MLSPHLHAARISKILSWKLLLLTCFAQAADGVNLIPWPEKVQLQEGRIPLTATQKIVTESALLPLAQVLADEIKRAGGPSLQATTGIAGTGDIALEIAPLEKESYTIDVSDKITVHGANYGSIAMGTVTLLQALIIEGPQAFLPKLKITDTPRADFRGLMVDVARQYHSIANLKQIVQLCRLYKIRYLQLHLTDDPAFTFPSTAYPQLTSKNWGDGKSYSLAELKDLVAYADARYVTIIPEFEVPGHSGAAIRAMKELLIIHDTKPYEHHASINFVRDDVMQLVETVTGEMCAVFKSSPYFHIGGDEADLALADQNVDFKAAMKQHDLPNVHELYRRFVVQMNDIVKKNHKQTIVWEGFSQGGKVKIPQDIIVMAYEMRFYQPDALLRDGYKVINASWVPLYVVNANTRPPAEIYAWNKQQFRPFGAPAEDRGNIVPENPNLIGATFCAWEQPETAEIPSLRGRLPAMSERLWNPTAGKSYADFSKRYEACDKLLTAMIAPISEEKK
jgi:hexosaminidase